MPWACIRGKPHNFIQQEFLEGEGRAGIKEPEFYDVDTLRKMVNLFFDHQEDVIPYDRGLIFLPCGTGSDLYYATKKGKGKGRDSKRVIFNIQIILTNFGKLTQNAQP